MRSIHDRIEDVARTVFDDDDLALKDATRARDVPAWDSLAHVMFMYGLEEDFDIQFSEEEFTGFANVGELERIIEAKLAAKTAT